MPKFYLYILIIVATTIGCTKKDWQCNCTVNGKDYTTTIINSAKMNAGNRCSNYGKSIGQQYGNYTYVCKVK